MRDTEDLAKHYSLLPTHKLSRLARKPEALPTAFVILLQRELLTRGEESEALNLSQYLKLSSAKGEKLTESKLAGIIKDATLKGQSYHDILIALKSRQVNISYSVYINNTLSEFLFQRVRLMKQRGAQMIDVEEVFVEEYGITREELYQLMERQKTRGKFNLFAGYAIVTVILILSFAGMFLGQYHMIWYVILSPIAIWRIVVGHRILNGIKL